MKQSKGVVMRVTGKKTVVYTKEGDFLEIPTPKNVPRAGQVIEVNSKPTRFPFKQTLFRYATVAAILVLVLALGVFNPLLGPNVAVASVSLEINSGLELYVDKQARVVEVNVVSDQLKQVLKDLKLKDMDLYQAVNLILKEARAKNVLLEDNNFVLASVIPIDDKGEKVVDEAKLRNTIRESMISKNISGVVIVGKTDQATKLKAEQMGLTVNRYLVYERCQQDGVQVHADEFSKGDMQQVLTSKNVSLPNLFPEDFFEVKHGDHSGQPGSNGANPNSNGNNNRSGSEDGAPQNMAAPGHDQNAMGQSSGHDGSANYSGQQKPMIKQQEKVHENTPAGVPGSPAAPSIIEEEQAGLSHEGRSNHN